MDRLPAASAYRQAMLDDPEVAEYLAQQPEPKGAARPSLEHFTPELAVLYVIADRLGDLQAGQVWAATEGKKTPKVTPLPRPVTGVERIRREHAKRQAESLIDDFKAAQQRWQQTRGGERGAGSE